MQPTNQEFKKVLTEIIKKQILVLGPAITIAKARNVKGLQISDDGSITEINGDPQNLTQQLLTQFKELSEPLVQKTMQPLLPADPPAPLATPTAPLTPPASPFTEAPQQPDGETNQPAPQPDPADLEPFPAPLPPAPAGGQIQSPASNPTNPENPGDNHESLNK